MTRRSVRLAAVLIVGSTVAYGAVRSAPAASSVARGPAQAAAPLLAFADNGPNDDSEIHVLRADGTGHRVLTDNRLNDRVRGWSPRGRWLTYTLLNRRGVGSVYARELKGPGFLRVGGLLRSHVWSPDERKVLTLHKTSGVLKVVDVATGSRRPVYSGLLLEGFGWSPDGTRIVFSIDRYFGPKVFVVRNDATERRRLVRGGTSPAWSPDGRWIAFLRDVSERYSTVHVVRPDGSGLRRLSPARINDGQGEWGWSPDGHWIAIEQYLTNGTERLGVLDVARGGVSWLSKGTRYGGQFRWMPDGKRIIFSCGSVDAFNVCRADVATGRARKLTRGLSVGYDVAFSPDGQRALFTNGKGVYVVDLPTRKLSRVTGSGYHLSWAPDGKWVAVQLQTGLHVVRLRDASVRRVTRHRYDDSALWQPRVP